MTTFSKPLVKAKLVKRYKRFLADVILQDGSVVTSHCPNTGSMRTCGKPDDIVYLLHSDDPKRKLAYTWELTETSNGYIGINTHRPNRIVEEAVLEQRIPELTGYESLKREVKYGENSKIDIYLIGAGRRNCYVEIKNVTLLEGDTLFFPDAVSVRALKHVKELEAMVAAGHRAVLFFLVNRPDGKYFNVASHIDTKYAEALIEAEKKGVEILCYRVDATLERLILGDPVPTNIILQ